MNNKTGAGVHWSFWAIGAVALLWNVMGIINLFAQMNADALAAMPEPQRAIVEGRPAWAAGAFAIAVFGGAIGCLLLLLRKSAANYVFIVSLLGMIAHMVPYLGMAGVTTVFGPSEIVMFMLLPLALAAFLIWYSKRAASRGWVS